MRSNLVIALGDLAFRFPNLLEPWTERIYGPLSDPDTGVSDFTQSQSCLIRFNVESASQPVCASHPVCQLACQSSCLSVSVPLVVSVSQRASRSG